MPFYVEPVQVGMGVLITVIGIPFYFVGVAWRNKPKFLQNMLGKVNAPSLKTILILK